MKKFVLLLALISIALIALACGSRSDTESWMVYEGKIPGYSVQIDKSRRESDPGDTYLIIAHVNLGTDKQFQYPIPWQGFDGQGRITGHGYQQKDGAIVWYRVFYCGYPESVNGCNSYLIDRDGKLTWEPCPADKDRLLPFSQQELQYALSQISLAVSEVYNEEHIVKIWSNNDGLVLSGWQAPGK